MQRSLFLLVVGLARLVNGGYDLYTGSGRDKPERTVTLPELIEDAVVSWKKNGDTKIDGSEQYYVPLQDGAQAGARAPSALLLIRQEKWLALKQNHRFESHHVHGLVLTRWDVENKARDYLVQRFGSAAVEAMVVVEYERDKGHLGIGLLKLVGGGGLLALALARLGRR